MPDFEIINNRREIKIDEGWIESKKFKSRYRRVDDEGKKTYEGRCYQLVAKHERRFSELERLGRGFLGSLLVVCSLGLVLLFKQVRNLFTKDHETRRFAVAVASNIYPLLPPELQTLILSYLDPGSLGKCQRVSKEWQLIANEKRLWEALPAPTIAFGKNEWIKYFGEIGEEPPLPLDIHKTLKTPCPIWEGKKVGETHMLVLIPEIINEKPLTLHYFEDLLIELKEGNSIQFDPMCGAIELELGDRVAPKAHWILMTKDVLPDSRGSCFEDQKKLVKGLSEETKLNYEIPDTLDAAVAISMIYVSSGERLFKQEWDQENEYVLRFEKSYVEPYWTFTRCQEIVLKRQVHVGNFTLSHLSISLKEYDSADFGVAAVRKLV